ncbi:MAG: Flp pilus assembly protein CpaB [Candidatus Omnitrophica bacterium]|nr:Flp pilus assembly protein CpaB [Candidatus Omnitrophota bacterium]
MERKWAIAIGVVLGLLAVILTNFYFQQYRAKFRMQEAAILVAARDISEGALINYDMLALQNFPVKFIQPGALQSKEAAVGKTALATIMAGEQILSTKLALPGRGLTLAGKTPPGKRAFTVGLDASAAVGGLIKPGDHVDVLAIFTNPAVTVALFQDILVLAVGQEMVPAEEGQAVRERLSAATAASYSRDTITLALSPQEVQIITVAKEQGKLRLTLRPRMETGDTLPQVDLSNLPPAIDLGTLLQLYIRPQEQGPSVEVIRGLKKEMTIVPTNKESKR